MFVFTSTFLYYINQWVHNFDRISIFYWAVANLHTNMDSVKTVLDKVVLSQHELGYQSLQCVTMCVLHAYILGEKGSFWNSLNQELSYWERIGLFVVQVVKLP